MNTKYLEKTKIVNFEHSAIQALIEERNWQELDDYNKIGAAYQFVKDEILFGYNESDDISASIHKQKNPFVGRAAKQKPFSSRGGFYHSLFVCFLTYRQECFQTPW